MTEDTPVVVGTPVEATPAATTTETKESSVPATTTAASATNNTGEISEEELAKVNFGFVVEN